MSEQQQQDLFSFADVLPKEEQLTIPTTYIGHEPLEVLAREEEELLEEIAEARITEATIALSEETPDEAEAAEDERLLSAAGEIAPDSQAEDVFYTPEQQNQIGLFGEQLEPWREHWKDMPEYVSQEMKPYAIVIVRFGSKQALDDFVKLTGQDLQRTSKSMWYPKPVPRGTHLDSSRRYVDGK